MRTETLIFSQLLTNEHYARQVLPHIKSEYFSLDEERNFFKIYERYFAKHTCIPSKQALRLEFENIKGSASVYKGLLEVILETEEFTENNDYLIEQTEKFCKERAVYNALKEAVLIVDGQDKKQSADSIPKILQDALSVCFSTSVGHDYKDDAEHRYEYYHAQEGKITTGVTEIDKVTKNGFSRKTLNLFLAPPHGGKSLVMVNIASGALLAGYNVLYITLEMSDMEMGKRFDVNMMDIDFDTLDSLPKQIFTNKFSQILDKSKGKLKIKEYPTKGAHAGHFRALLEEYKTKQGFVPDLIVIDYLGICSSEKYKAGANVSTYIEMKSVGEELRALSFEANCAIVSAIQTNRAGVENSDVSMAEISESIGNAMTADFIAAIINTDELKSLSQIMFKLIKNRYAGIVDNNKFIMGVNYSKMKLHSVENSFNQKSADKPRLNKYVKPRIETANDTFDTSFQIKPEKSSFDDFNF